MTILYPIIIVVLVALNVIKPKIYMKQFEGDVMKNANYYTSYSREYYKKHLHTFYEVKIVVISFTKLLAV